MLKILITVHLTATFPSTPLPKDCMKCSHYKRTSSIFLIKMFLLRDKVMKLNSPCSLLGNRKDFLILTDSFVESLMSLLNLHIVLCTCTSKGSCS